MLAATGTCPSRRKPRRRGGLAQVGRWPRRGQAAPPLAHSSGHRAWWPRSARGRRRRHHRAGPPGGRAGDPPGEIVGLATGVHDHDGVQLRRQRGLEPFGELDDRFVQIAAVGREQHQQLPLPRHRLHPWVAVPDHGHVVCSSPGTAGRRGRTARHPCGGRGAPGGSRTAAIGAAPDGGA